MTQYAVWIPENLRCAARHSIRLLTPVLIVLALLLPLGTAPRLRRAVQLGELFRDLLRGGTDEGVRQRTASRRRQPPRNPLRPLTAGKRVPFGQAEMELSFAPLVKETAPAVVNVYASQQAQGRRSPFEGDPFFEQFFGRQMPPRAQQSSLGSGVAGRPQRHRRDQLSTSSATPTR